MSIPVFYILIFLFFNPDKSNYFITISKINQLFFKIKNTCVV